MIKNKVAILIVLNDSLFTEYALMYSDHGVGDTNYIYFSILYFL